jgi:8-oxo-dGTP diphosphatase
LKRVAAAIAYRGDHVLVTRRAPGQNLEGYWEFPGGKLEQGESVARCIERELQEELGVRSIGGEVIAEAVHEYPGGAIKLIGIEVELLDSNLRLSVHDAAEFVSPSELLSMQLAPADIPLAEEVARRHRRGIRKV